MKFSEGHISYEVAYEVALQLCGIITDSKPFLRYIKQVNH